MFDINKCLSENDEEDFSIAIRVSSLCEWKKVIEFGYKNGFTWCSSDFLDYKVSFFTKNKGRIITLDGDENSRRIFYYSDSINNDYDVPNVHLFKEIKFGTSFNEELE